MALNTVDSIEGLTADVKSGQWYGSHASSSTREPDVPAARDRVLRSIQTLSMPQNKVIEVYEQMVYRVHGGSWLSRLAGDRDD